MYFLTQCVYIHTEPGFDYLHALTPYQPLNMKVSHPSSLLSLSLSLSLSLVAHLPLFSQSFYFPIDPCMNFFVANKLLKELQVGVVVLVPAV